MGCHFFLQEIFPTQGLNPGLPHCRQTLYHLSHQGSPIRTLLELINEFSKVSGYKISTQKSHAFLYINNEKSEREIKESIPLAIATKRIKYLGINLAKESKELYTENKKTLMKEVKDHIIDEEIFHVPG